MVLENVSLSFDARGLRGVRNLSLSISPGEILGIIGPSGAGKSTIVKLLSGELTPNSGRVLRPAAVAQLCDDGAFHSPQQLQHWLEAAQSSEPDLERRVQRARDVADVLELTQELLRPLSALSQGQWQRARLAHALVAAPELLLLDEPFAHLDPVLRGEVVVALMQLLARRATAVVWVGHEVHELLAYAHRLAVLNFGAVEQLAPPRELFQAPKNLTVARLLGHKNFLIYQRQNDSWKGALGDYRRSVLSSRPHVVLSLPADAVQLDDQGPHSAQLRARRFAGFYEELELSMGEQTLHVQHRGPLRAQVGEKLHFRVSLDEAVVIDCL